MPQIITCPDCGRTLKVPDDLIGKRVKCPGCGQKFVGETEKPIEEDADEAPVSRSSAVASRPDAAPRSRRRDEEDEEDDDRPKSRRRDDDEEDEDYPVRKRRRDDGRPEPTKGEIAKGWQRVRFGLNLLIIAVWISVGTAVVGVLGWLCLVLFGVASFGSMTGGSLGGPLTPQQAHDMAGHAAGTGAAILVGGCVVGGLVSLLWLAYLACRTTGLGFFMGIAPSRKTQTLRVLAIAVFSIACANLVIPLISFGGASLLSRDGGGCTVLPTYGLWGLLFLGDFVCLVLFLRGVAAVMKKEGLAQNLLYYMIAFLVYALTLPIIPVILAFAFGAAMFGTLATANPHSASGAAGNAAGAGAAVVVGGLACVGLEILIGLGLFVWYVVLLYQVRSAVDGRLDRD